MRRIATALALSAIFLTPAICLAGEKSPADRGAADRAAAEKAASAEKADKAAIAEKLDKADKVSATKASAPASPIAPEATQPSAATPPAADAPPAAPTPDKPAADPLNLRPTHALEPATPAPTLGLGTKLALAALIGGAAFFVYKRRSGVRPAKLSALRVTARASIGARTEVCVVEIDGQRLLIGVTPSSIRTLTVLTEEALIEQETAPSAIEEGFKRLLSSARRDIQPEPEAEPETEELEEPSVRRLHAAPASRPVASLRSGRPAVLPESGRPSVASGRATIASAAARTVEQPAASTKKTASRRASPAVEGQVSGLLTMRSGRS